MHILTILFFRMLIWVFLSAMTLHAEQRFENGVDNKISKVYHHKGPLAHEFVFYLPGRPIINHIPDAPFQKVAGNGQESTKERYRFFMPLTSINKQHLADLAEFGNANHLYTVTATPTNKPMKGLEVVVVFDKQHVGFQVEVFPAITGDNAVTFKFLIRAQLEKINNKSHPIIRNAYAGELGKKNFISC